MESLMRWLAARDISQREFANLIGLTPGAISQWVAANEIPLRRVALVAKVTGISPRKLRPDVFGVAA